MVHTFFRSGGGDPFTCSSLHSLFSDEGCQILNLNAFAVYLFVPNGVMIYHCMYGSWSKNPHSVMVIAMLVKQRIP